MGVYEKIVKTSFLKEPTIRYQTIKEENCDDSVQMFGGHETNDVKSIILS